MGVVACWKRRHHYKEVPTCEQPWDLSAGDLKQVVVEEELSLSQKDQHHRKHWTHERNNQQEEHGCDFDYGND